MKAKTKRVKSAALYSQWAGFARWRPLPVLVMLVSGLILGCLTPSGRKLSALVQKREAGEISEAQYQDELRKIKETEPWGPEPRFDPASGWAPGCSPKWYDPSLQGLTK